MKILSFLKQFSFLCKDAAIACVFTVEKEDVSMNYRFSYKKLFFWSLMALKK